MGWDRRVGGEWLTTRWYGGGMGEEAGERTLG